MFRMLEEKTLEGRPALPLFGRGAV